MIDRLRKVPTGMGNRKLEKESLLPVEPVANEVIWVNPHIKAPFKIEMGKSSDLGIFAGSLDHRPYSTLPYHENQQFMEASRKHGRSLILGRVIFRDKTGKYYRDVDVKGIGSVARLTVNPLGGYTSDLQRVAIFERLTALKDAALAEELVEAGVRTYRVIAITKLKEVISDGKKYSIDEAKREDLIDENSEPAVSIRAFGIRDRIDDLKLDWRRNDDLEGQQRDRNIIINLIEDARLMAAQEEGLPASQFEILKYYQWFIRTLAKNVALMHKAGFVHTSLTPHNITLDCRIVDLDSVTALGQMSDEKSEGLKTADLRECLKTLDSFFSAITHVTRSVQFDYRKQFIQAYRYHEAQKMTRLG